MPSLLSTIFGTGPFSLPNNFEMNRNHLLKTPNLFIPFSFTKTFLNLNKFTLYGNVKLLVCSILPYIGFNRSVYMDYCLLSSNKFQFPKKILGFEYYCRILFPHFPTPSYSKLIIYLTILSP